jgi:uncharacterized protein (UPF0333 family)
VLEYYYKNKKGNVLVEFALIMPILLLLIAGIIQFGFILNAKVAVNSASYEAARAATLSENPETDAINAVSNYAASSLSGWNLKERLGVKVDLSGNDPGDIVRIIVSYNVPVFFSSIISGSGIEGEFFKVIGTSTMQIEEKE